MTGSRSMSRDRSAIAGGIVALKNSVWRRLGMMAQNATDVWQESHVQHPVRFVKDEDFEARQLRVRRAEVVEQPARVCRR